MTADGIFDEIAENLASQGAVAGGMFGKRALKAHGKAFACLKGDLLAFRLIAGTSAHDDALTLSGAELFDPSGNKRPFKDWVAVPTAHSGQWPRLAETALGLLTD
jgi:hypothetical protein